MTSSRLFLVTGVAGLAFAASLAADGAERKSSAADAGPFHQAILDIAAEYKAWGRIDDEMRWAPTYCRPTVPGQVYVSASQDDKTHGRKLYSLFARRRDEYLGLRKSADPLSVGQAIVKQSWVPEEIHDPKQRPDRRTAFDRARIVSTPALRPDPKSKNADGGFDSFYPYVWNGDKVFKATKQSDLFVMLKLDPATPGTDDGWIYATTTPDGKSVTSVGRIESCMNCHKDATRDRLFGLADQARPRSK